jgi:aryl-alcohol dehydrogenase-like predicted oxidoreductase
MLPGYGTAEATARYAERHFANSRNGFFRRARNLTVSSLGIGTYLGAMNDETDRRYRDSILAALRGGVNFIDTSLNYRHQRSERAIGHAIVQMESEGKLNREEIVICTKAGYLVPGAVQSDILRQEEIAGGMHSIAPAFLADQLSRSLSNLGIRTVDVFYLHNPETQLAHVPADVFYQRIEAAFAMLEHLVSASSIQYYGVATWDAFRKRPGEPGAVSLEKLVEIAARVAGPQHHFRFVQLPFNLAMHEAYTLLNSGDGGRKLNVLNFAESAGLTVVASASLLQAKLIGKMPEALVSRFPGAETDAQRAIQFTRSTPGITVALAGMSRPEHVYENLRISQFPPLEPEEYAALIGTAA